MRQHAYILTLLLAALAAGCASETDYNAGEDISQGTDPMQFTCQTQEGEQGHATRAAQLLTTGFVVNTYKAYALPAQHTVMDAYQVEYKTTGTAWDGNVRPYWDYTKVSGQYEKFWDYSAFPYRFHAVAPYPAPGAVTMSDTQLRINAPYSMQTVINGMVTPQDAEPYLVAQLQRGANGRDYDLMASQYTDDGHHAVGTPKEVNTGSQSRSRYVELPFHHLNSKVRFGIYSTSPWTTATPLYIEGLTIRVYSPGFITAATGYQSDGTTTIPDILGGPERSWYIGNGNSGFQGLQVFTPASPVFGSSAAEKEILRFDGGKEVTGNDMTHHQGRSSAFWLQCQQGIMQIPQEHVQLCVTFNLRTMDGTLYKAFNDVPIQMEDGTRQYNWLSGYIHTYYLIIGDIEDQLEITFTATLTPWEDVSGSLNTDLEQ